MRVGSGKVGFSGLGTEFRGRRRDSLTGHDTKMSHAGSQVDTPAGCCGTQDSRRRSSRYARPTRMMMISAPDIGRGRAGPWPASGAERCRSVQSTNISYAAIQFQHPPAHSPTGEIQGSWDILAGRCGLRASHFALGAGIRCWNGHLRGEHCHPAGHRLRPQGGARAAIPRLGCEHVDHHTGPSRYRSGSWSHEYFVSRSTLGCTAQALGRGGCECDMVSCASRIFHRDIGPVAPRHRIFAAIVAIASRLCHILRNRIPTPPTLDSESRGPP